LEVSGKRVLLISPERHFPMDNEMYPSGALLLLGTLLKNRGHTVKIVHMVADKVSIDGITSIVRDFNPGIVGLTASTFQTKQTKTLTRYLKTLNEKTRIVIGGPHPSALKQDALKDFPYVDIAVLGEGEKPFVEIVEEVPLHQINGICYREGSKVINNPPSPLLQDLDKLPFPDLNFINLSRYSGPYPLGRRPGMFIMASRGCPYKCVFCSKSVYGSTVRYHSPDYVISLVEYLHKGFGVKEVFFQDDTFNLNRAWTEDILHKIIQSGLNKTMIFRTPFRVNEKLVDRELLKLMKEAGFWLIFYGVENGNQDMLDRMKKGITVEEVKRAFKLTHEAGIKAEAAFIIGLPGETEATIKDSIKLWREIKPYRAGFSRAIPFPDTAFERGARMMGNIICKDYDEYAPDKMMVRTETMTAEQLEKWAQYCSKLLFIDTTRILMTHPVELYRAIKDVGAKGISARLLRLGFQRPDKLLIH
jgi:anaerobic magnesium-protoporphyrin IX monomethyl ester cyclase